MKTKINQLLNQFESKFNFMIELLAFIGGLFSILLSIVLFFIIMFKIEWLNSLPLLAIFLPGIIGFLGVAILLILRITRYLTR